MIYIIGGNGFVGSAIVRACMRSGIEHEVLSRDTITDFTNKKCDIIINANGNSKKFLSDRDPIWDFDASVKSVFESLVNIYCDKYIYLSSCDVYTDCANPFNNKETSDISVSMQSSYGFHKYLAEQCVINRAPEWIIFRMGGFVGPGLKKNAIYDILHGGPLWLDPNSELQFINVDAAADIIISIARSDKRNEIFNLCGTGVIRLSEILSFIGEGVECKQGSPLVRYEINTEKVRSIAEIESSRDAVLSYIKTYMACAT